MSYWLTHGIKCATITVGSFTDIPKKRTQALSCRNCGMNKPVQTQSNLKRRQFCRDCLNVVNKEYYYRIRDELIQRLGGYCICCGTLDNLSIDHINPERLRQGTRQPGLQTYLTMRRIQNLEQICQVLCTRCNTSKWIYLECRLHSKNESR